MNDGPNSLPTITSTVAPSVADMVSRIVDEVDPQKVVLFGSQARGDAIETSDVDFLIVMNQPVCRGEERLSLMTRLWEQQASLRGPKDILVCGTDEVQRWKDTQNHVIARALDEGEVVYERS